MKGYAFATAAIWITFAILVGSLLTTPTGAIAHAGDAAIFGITLALALAAAISTIVIWATVLMDQRRNIEAAHMAQGLPINKAKRQHADRIERLIASLDDEDIYELEARLLDRNTQTHEQNQSS
jgi:hypothetical protein